MNEPFVTLAREVFTAASSTGVSGLPAGLERVLTQIDDGAVFSAEAIQGLNQQLCEQFSFLRQRSLVLIECDDFKRRSWEFAVRAVLGHLSKWSSSSPNAFERLKALLYTLDLLGLDSADVEALVTQFKSDELKAGLYKLLCETEVTSFLPHQDLIPNADQSIKESALQKNFVKIGHLLRHIMPQPKAELWSAVRLLWRLEPSRLVEAVTVNDNVFFTLLVQKTLQDNFPALALFVPILWVKFLGVRALEEASRRGGNAHDWGDLLYRLLLQAADVHAWRSWLEALVPGAVDDLPICIAFSKALVTLRTSHRVEFVDAVRLDYSKQLAGPIANVMMMFASNADAPAVSAMWSACFDRWNAWNYGKGETQFYMFSPTSSAFDYPVSKYYSELNSHERDAEEAALSLTVENIEQQWFASASDLVTERNRLLSRLRLVEHGRRMANGVVAPLPPDIQPPDAYNTVRYSYHQV